tara:strand:- start:8140 stop:9405 length:1266 start_codon:yes stop_codon:yes gene_type:complete
MKILIVNFSDTTGGAARAAYRLNTLLVNEGVDSKMLVNEKNSDNYNVLSPETNTKKILAKFQAILNPFPLKKYKNTSPFSTSFVPSFNLVKKINDLEPDIVHLHWINAGMLNVKDISKIKAPIVWSLHDMWAFTGGCHYSDGCEKFKNKCGNCPILSLTKENDLSRNQFLKKSNSYNKKENFTVVALSSWLKKEAENSMLFKNRTIVNLPNPIDTNIYKPFDKNKARELWGLSNEKKYILFGAMSNASYNRKGFKQLKESLKYLKDDDNNIELIIFGASKPEKSLHFGFPEHYLGQINDDVALKTLYNLADVTVVPSLQENLSNVIMESLSCGTPVVGFNIGGNKDLINHKQNGYLAEPFKVEDLSKGIQWVLDHNNVEKLRENAREKVVNTFDNKIVLEQYLNLYNSILNKEKTSSLKTI